MKHLRTILTASLLMVLTVSALAGCGKDKQTVTCPFTKMTWENTVDDVLATEGDDYTTYDSVYNGTTYVFSKNYLDLEGTIKYMFDDSDKLMCVAWSYSSDSEEEVKNTYNQIHKQVQDTYGESSYNTELATNSGDVWYLDEGDIILSVVSTDTQNALQYSYLNPEVSNKEAKD